MHFGSYLFKTENEIFEDFRFHCDEIILYFKVNRLH